MDFSNFFPYLLCAVSIGVIALLFCLGVWAIVIMARPKRDLPTYRRHPATVPTPSIERTQSGALRVARLIMPNPIAIRRDFDKLRTRYPDADVDYLLDKVIDKACFQAGVVGFFTGLAGAPGAIAMLPVDFYATGRIQAAMVQSSAYGLGDKDDLDDDEMTVQQIALLTIGVPESLLLLEKAAHGVINAIVRRLAIRIAGKTIFEVFPIIGGVVGYGINYYFARGSAHLAIRHYRAKQEKYRAMLERTAQNANNLPVSTENKLTEENDAGEIPQIVEGDLLHTTPEEVSNMPSRTAPPSTELEKSAPTKNV